MDRAELHRRISYGKSIVRIGGYALLPASILLGAGVLILSELLGIAEEVWGA